MALLRPRAFLTAVLLLSSLTVGLGVTPAYAQEADQDTARTVLDLVKSANEAFDNGQFADALARYQEAYDLYPDAVLLYRIGLAADQLGEAQRAIEAYEMFAAAKSEEAAAEKALERAAALRATLPGTLTIQTVPTGVAVTIAGESYGVTPLQLTLAPGETEVVLSQEGYATVTTLATVEAGATEALEVTMQLTPSPAAGSSSATSDGLPLATYGWITTGVGVALLGTGVAFAAMTTQAVNDVNDYDKRTESASRTEYESLIDKATNRHNTSVGFIVAGGIVTAAGVTLIVVDALTGKDEARAQQWVPNLGVTGDGAFVGVTARF